MVINWVGKDCMIPGFGEVRNGDTVEMPEQLAEVFIREGKATKLRKAKKGAPVTTEE